MKNCCIKSHKITRNNRIMKNTNIRNKNMKNINLNITKSKRKTTIITILTIIIMTMMQGTVFAANYSVNVDFDGKNIEMFSENPKMEWNVRNLYVGEPTETTVVLNSTGNKEVEVELKPELVEGQEIGEILKLKIINNKTNEIAYEGQYADFQSIKTKIPAKETISFKVIIEKTAIDDKDIQNATVKIKFKVIASGEKSSSIHTRINNNYVSDDETLNNNEEQKNENEENSNNENKENSNNENKEETNNGNQSNEAEKQVEKVTTDEIKQIKKQEAYVMYFVLGIMLLVLGILVIQFLKTKK